jgi:ubiquinone/menaquinone biosynthesis C-methylase UbiE
MQKIKTKEISEYFAAPPELLPYIPELLNNLMKLGSSPDLFVQWLKPFRFPAYSTRVLDIGCGAGTIALNLAKELKFQVFGFDFFKPFISNAQKAAKKMKIANLCQFECADFRGLPGKAKDFHIVVYTGVGGVLGSFDQCLAQLRSMVRKGGYIIIDDGFRLSNNPTFIPGYKNYVHYADKINQLKMFGDIIVFEEIFTKNDIKLMNQKNIEAMAIKVEYLAKQFPQYTDLLYWYLDHQIQECELMEKDLGWAVWMLKKM